MFYLVSARPAKATWCRGRRRKEEEEEKDTTTISTNMSFNRRMSRLKMLLLEIIGY